MRRSKQALAGLVMGFGMVATIAAQQTTQVHPGTGGSPHVRTDWTIDGAKICDRVRGGRTSRAVPKPR